MASLGQTKTLGGVGSILILLLPVPSVGGILSIIGWILVLFAVKNIADALGDNRIFNNMLIAAVLSIVGIIVAIGLVLAAVFSFVGLGSYNFTPGTPPPADFYALIGTILLGLAVIWIFYIVASIFLKRSYDAIGQRINVGTFHTTGLLFLIGSITTIIFVGFLIVLIAIILQIVAFFSISEQLTQQQGQPWGPQPPSPPTPPPQTI